MRTSLWIAVSTVILLASSASAWSEPATVLPGNAAVDGSFIQPYVTKWKVMGRAPDGSVIQMGTWSDATRIDRIKGREVLIRRQLWLHDKGAEGYYNIVDHKTMQPVLSQHVNSLGTYRRFEFGPDDKTVRYAQFQPRPPEPGKALPMNAPMQQGALKLKEPYFDFNCGMFGLLIAGFPLKEGYSARFPVFRSYDPKVAPAWIDFTVKGKEVISAGPYKNLDTWLVVVNSPDTDEVITLNLAKVPPYVIELRQPWEGRDWTFEMVDVTTPPAAVKPAA
jgi:hypothetical protein